MSTVPKNDSDSEDDDYVPPADDDSDSSEEPELKPVLALLPSEIDEEAKKKARDALWASFQESVAMPHVTSQPGPPKEMIKVEKRYRFAGEDVVELVDVAVDSPDAKKWPVWRPPESEGTAPVTSRSGTPTVTPTLRPSVTDTLTAETASAKPLAKRPGPRKPKVSLAAIPTQKAKKLSTLDKSAMDWRTHVQAQEDSGLKDELEANRRSGGYLEKVEFLKRVDERKEDVIETSKSSKRRRL